MLVNTLLTFRNYPFPMAIIDFPARPFPLRVISQSSRSSASIWVLSLDALSTIPFEAELSCLILKKIAPEGDPPGSVASTLGQLLEPLEDGLRISQLQILGYELDAPDGWFDLIVVIDTERDGKSSSLASNSGA